MRLFGAMEYLIVTVGNDGTLHGMRLQRRHKRLTVIRALEVPPDERSAADRLADLCRKLDRRRDMTLVIGAAFRGRFSSGAGCRRCRRGNWRRRCSSRCRSRC